MCGKIIQFITLTIYVCILNVFFFLLGNVFIEDYMCWSASKLNLGHFFLVVLYSFIQTIVFPLEKKFNIVIVSVLSLLCGLWFTYFDNIGFGNELWCDVVLSISKCNHFLGLTFLKRYPALLQTNFSFLYSIYIYLVGYSYKLFYEKILYNRIVRKNKCDNKCDNILP
jgi:hypothetical protein